MKGSVKGVMVGVVLALALGAQAKSYGDLLYRTRYDDTVVITNSLPAIKGALVIPAEIKGGRVVELNPPSGAPGVFLAQLGLTAVTIPGSVTNVAKETFADCEKLAKVTFADLSGFVRIGSKAFQDTAAKTVVLPRGVELVPNSFYDSDFEQVTFTGTVPPAGLDEALNRIRESDGKLKVKISKIEIPYSADLAAWKAVLPKFLARRGLVVRASAPRVWFKGDEAGTVEVLAGARKLASGAVVKPGTKLACSGVPAAGFALKAVSAVAGTNETTFTAAKTPLVMPKEDLELTASFLTAAEEREAFQAALDAMADGVLTGDDLQLVPVAGVKVPCVVGRRGEPLAADVCGMEKFATAVDVSFVGLSGGLSPVVTSNACQVAGVPSERLDVAQAPAFVTFKTASGLAATRRLNLQIEDGEAAPAQLDVVRPPAGPGVQVDATGSEVRLLAGTAFGAGEGPAFSCPAGAKVTAANLPTGLRLAKQKDGTYVLTGTATKAGNFYVTITYKVNGVARVRRVLYRVQPHPLAGSYAGYVATPGVGFGTVAMTVDAQGRATLTLVEGKTRTSVKGVAPTIAAWGADAADDWTTGTFAYAFALPADKKRNLPARTVEMAYLGAESRQGEIRVWPVGSARIVSDGAGATEAIRCWPYLTAAQLANPETNPNGAALAASAAFVVNAQSADGFTGGTVLATVSATVAKQTLKVAGRLPSGKAFTASVPAVLYDRERDGVPTFEKTLAYAPILAEDVDGTCYKLILTLDPSAFGKSYTGLARWDAATGAFVEVVGTELYRTGTVPASLPAAFGALAGPETLTLTAVAPGSKTVESVTATLAPDGRLTLDGAKPVKPTLDKKTGMLKFSLASGTEALLFEGVWTDNGTDAFRGYLSGAKDKKVRATAALSLLQGADAP